MTRSRQQQSRQADPRISRMAATALVLAIVSLPVWAWFIPAIASIVLSRRARKAIRTSGGKQSGGGLAATAFVLGIVSLVMAVLVSIAFYLLISGLGQYCETGNCP